MAHLSVRPAQPIDSENIWKCHVQSIRKVCSKDYPLEVITAWSAFPYVPERWSNAMKEDAVWVLVCENTISGFCHAKMHDPRTGEIMGLYLAPESCGLGGGRLLIEKALNFFREKKADRIVLDSTRTAEGFYKSFGFQRFGNSKFIEKRSQQIECLPMEAILSIRLPSDT